MDLHRLFFPESVAVVGASPHLGGGKMPYYQILQMAGYKGRLYPVNPKYTDINGAKVYPSLDDLPESVDLAIAGVPASMALETVKAAARKRIRFLHFFTSGFSEIGNHELKRNSSGLPPPGGPVSSDPTASASTAPHRVSPATFPRRRFPAWARWPSSGSRAA